MDDYPGNFILFFFVQRRGNGLCDNHLNTAGCDYDGGDCCKETCVPTVGDCSLLCCQNPEYEVDSSGCYVDPPERTRGEVIILGVVSAIVLIWMYRLIIIFPLRELLACSEIVALSYMWMSAQHPDPDGRQLRYLAPLIERFEERTARPSFFFIDYMSLHQHTADYVTCTVEAPEIEGGAKGSDHYSVRRSDTNDLMSLSKKQAVILVEDTRDTPEAAEAAAAEKYFYGRNVENGDSEREEKYLEWKKAIDAVWEDHCSWVGKQMTTVGATVGVRIPRAPKEDESFGRGLKSTVNLFYGSERTSVWMLTKAPSIRRYGDSGWCSTEQSISSVITPSRVLLDIGQLYDMEMDTPSLIEATGTEYDSLVIKVGGTEVKCKHAEFGVKMKSFAGRAVRAEPFRLTDEHERFRRRCCGLWPANARMFEGGVAVLAHRLYNSAQQAHQAMTAGATAVLLISANEYFGRPKAFGYLGIADEPSFSMVRSIDIPVLMLPASAAALFDNETEVTFEGSQSVVAWDGSVVQASTARRAPPQHLKSFNESIETKHFVSGADYEVVKNIFQRNYRFCIKGAKQLDFADLLWTDYDLAKLEPVLADCSQLLILDLHGNAFSMAGLRPLLKHLSGIRVLDIRGLREAEGRVEEDEIRAACPRLITLKLRVESTTSDVHDPDLRRQGTYEIRQLAREQQQARSQGRAEPSCLGRCGSRCLQGVVYILTYGIAWPFLELVFLIIQILIFITWTPAGLFTALKNRCSHKRSHVAPAPF